jgi:hypothetical protein
LAADVRALGHGATSPSVVQSNDQSTDQEGTIGNSGPTGGNISCSCQSAHCNTCTAESMNMSRMNGTNEHVSVASFLSSAVLSLSLFDDNSDTNPVFHL